MKAGLVVGTAIIAGMTSPAGDAKAAGGMFNNVEYTCIHARLIVESEGYDVIRMADCAGQTYGFLARRGGRTYYVTFDTRWGWIDEVEPVSDR